MTEENLNQELKDQVSAILGDFEQRSEKQLKELQDQRVIRAEKFADYMRTWLTILTPTITGAFIIAGLIGYRSISDLEGFKKQMQQNVDAVAARKQEVDAEVQKAEQELRALREHVQTLQENLSNLETRFATINLK